MIFYLLKKSHGNEKKRQVLHLARQIQSQLYQGFIYLFTPCYLDYK